MVDACSSCLTCCPQSCPLGFCLLLKLRQPAFMAYLQLNRTTVLDYSTGPVAHQVLQFIACSRLACSQKSILSRARAFVSYLAINLRFTNSKMQRFRPLSLIQDPCHSSDFSQVVCLPTIDPFLLFGNGAHIILADWLITCSAVHQEH